jgi:hypothetical protein
MPKKPVPRLARLREDDRVSLRVQLPGVDRADRGEPVSFDDLVDLGQEDDRLVLVGLPLHEQVLLGELRLLERLVRVGSTSARIVVPV